MMGKGHVLLEKYVKLCIVRGASHGSSNTASRWGARQGGGQGRRAEPGAGVASSCPSPGTLGSGARCQAE